MNKVIQQGEIWHLDLEPTKGREQRGKRFCLVVSQTKFNAHNTVWIVPITTGGTFAKLQGFTVSLDNEDLNTKGLILCHQLRTVDIIERGGRFIEKISDELLEEVMEIISTILGQ